MTTTLDAYYAQIDAEDTARRAMPVSMLDAALWYARTLHWPVFPLQPTGKVPLVDRAAGFLHGFQDATCDAGRIEAAWTRCPDANLAVPTGAAGCGYDVLDVDGPVGYRSWLAVGGPGEAVEQAARALTPRGMHVYVAACNSRNTANLLPGIDVRGDGGYVVLPPSVNAAGRRYAWAQLP